MRQVPWALLVVSFCSRCFLETIVKLGEKVENTRLIPAEDFFFLEITMIFGEKSKKRNQSLFSLENINFWKFLPQTPEFKYPALHSGIVGKN